MSDTEQTTDAPEIPEQDTETPESDFLAVVTDPEEKTSPAIGARYCLADGEEFVQTADALCTVKYVKQENGTFEPDYETVLPGILELSRSVAMKGIDPVDRRPKKRGDEDQASHLIYRPRYGVEEVPFRYLTSDSLESRPEWWIQSRIAMSTTKTKLGKVDTAIKAMASEWQSRNGGWMNGYSGTGILLRDGEAPVFLRVGAGALTAEGVDDRSQVELPVGFENTELQMDDPSTDAQFPGDLANLLRIADTTPKDSAVGMAILGLLEWAPWGNLYGMLTVLVDALPGTGKTSLAGLLIEAQSRYAINWRGTQVIPTVKLRDLGSSAVGFGRKLSPFGGAVAVTDDPWNGNQSLRDVQKNWTMISTLSDNVLTQSSGEKGNKAAKTLREQEIPAACPLIIAEKVPNLRENVGVIRRLVLLNLTYVDKDVMDEVRGDAEGTGSRKLSRAHARLVQRGLTDLNGPKWALDKARELTSDWEVPENAVSVLEWYARLLAGVILTADAVREARVLDPSADLPEPEQLISRAVEVFHDACDRQTLRGGWRGLDAAAGTPESAWLRAIRKLWADQKLWVASGTHEGVPYKPPVMDELGGPGAVGWTQGSTTTGVAVTSAYTTQDQYWAQGKAGLPCGFYAKYGGHGKKTFDHMLRVKATHYGTLHAELDAYSTREYNAPLPTPEEMLEILDTSGILASTKAVTAQLAPELKQRSYTFNLARILGEEAPEEDPEEDQGEVDPGPQDPAPAPAPVVLAPAPVDPLPAEEATFEEESLPCAVCGVPTPRRVNGIPNHVRGVCTPGPAPVIPHQTTTEETAVRPAPADTVTAESPAAKPAPEKKEKTTAPSITERVTAALEQTGGDQDAAIAALKKHAIQDSMAILQEIRASGRYDLVAYPKLPGIMKRPGPKMADEIWEARPSWTNAAVPKGTEVERLDTNAAYLTAMNTHLPLGELVHSESGEFDRKRSGAYLITPPEWTHTDLPNPLGNRDTPGKLWVMRPTLQLLVDLSTPKYGQLCEAPVIHESWTSGSTESLLRGFKETLRDARTLAIKAGDKVTEEYVKAMYSKFTSTMTQESTANRALKRSDWAHTIRSQAHGNLVRKAVKARAAGLTVYRAVGTDELHVVGDWRPVFGEGRALTEMKLKDVKGDEGLYRVGEKRPATEDTDKAGE